MTGPGAAAPRRPLVAVDREELARARAGLGGRVAVVMTMGALHEGHAELLRQARARADSVLATIYVNPLQFGPGEDLERYPRTLAADLEVCAEQGVDVVFAPRVVHDPLPVVTLSAGGLGTVFDGASRPGHFDGMLTVVATLLHLTRPDVALFGQKDAQQLACIRAMVRDLALPVEIVGVPTVREADGLARSSRNRYLDDTQRIAALAFSRALQAARDIAAAGGGVGAARVAAEQVLDVTPGVVRDYVAVVDPDTFAELSDGARPADGAGGTTPATALVLVAGWVGTTRLIDNSPVTFHA